jgi:predicted nicotinamide N-methyase
MFSLQSFQEQYNPETTPVKIRDKSFQFFIPRDINPFVNQDDIFDRFPLWAKIWEASLVLADYLAGLEPRPNKKILEIGCGLGLVGIIAASFGHRVVMTEVDEHALTFARANILLNHVTNIEVMGLDWTDPMAGESFDTIVGSEIAFRETDFKPLSDLFKTYLGAGGEIVLAEGIRETSLKFMKHLSTDYHISAKKLKLRSHDKEIPIVLARISPK